MSNANITAEWRETFATLRKEKDLIEWHPTIDRFEPVFFEMYKHLVNLAGQGEPPRSAREYAEWEAGRAASIDCFAEIANEVFSSPLRERFLFLAPIIPRMATEQQLAVLKSKCPHVLWGDTRVYICPT